MNFESLQVLEQPASPEDGPELSESIKVICTQCRRKSASASSDNKAVGSALGDGWKLRLFQPPSREFVGVADLTFGAEIFCPKCFAAEFETET